MCVCERDREGLQKLPKLCRAFEAINCRTFFMFRSAFSAFRKKNLLIFGFFQIC